MVQFLLFVLLVLIILILINLSTQKKNLEEARNDLGYLKLLLQRLEKEVSVLKPSPEKKPSATSDIPPAPVPVTKPPEPTPKKIVEPLFEISRPVEQKSESSQVQPPVAVQPASARQPQPKTREKRDLEKFIGENLINKIGIIILVLGVGYFVKYAIDQQWIHENGRAAIGILTGGLLIGLAHRMRKLYRTFSSVLVGGGFAVLYLTITISFQLYHLFDPKTAFALLILITAFSVALSIAYDKKELAIFSQIGGYLCPFMVATGHGDYITLFTYMLILNAGLITLAYYKRWYILNLLSFIFTILIFSGWICTVYLMNDPMPTPGAFIFAFLFYLVFFVVNILKAVREHQPLKGSEMTLILSDNLFFFLSGMAILYNLNEGFFKGIFTLSLALYNFGWLIYLYRTNQSDKNLIYLLVGLVMSFISLAIPIQLNGHSITLFWTAEFVILLWLARKTGITLLRYGHLIILVLIVISLTMDWIHFYGTYAPNSLLTVILNQPFITGSCVVAGMGITLYLMEKGKETFILSPFLETKHYRVILITLIILFSYLIGIFELYYQMNRYYTLEEFCQVVYALYNFSFLAICLLIFEKFQNRNLIKAVYYCGGILLAVYFIFYNPAIITVRDNYLTHQGMSVLNFLFHYVLLVPVTILIIQFLRNREELTGKNSLQSKFSLWFVIFSIVYIASAELDNLILFTQWRSNADFTHLLTISHRAGYPILWAVIAFLLMLQGMQKTDKDYRILSLCLLSLIILKMFMFDVWSMNEGGRVASFIFLGFILLIVSFLYQKLKRLIMEDKTNQSGNK